MPTETENKKHNILSRAIELFSQRGFEGVSVREIAEASDCNLAAISYYFGGKEKLYEVCSNLINADEVKSVCTALSSPKGREDFVQKIGLFVQDLGRLIHQNSKIFRIHINKFNSQPTFETDLEETLLGPCYKAVREFLSEGSRINVVRPNTDSKFQSRVLILLILTEVIYHGLGAREEDFQKFSQEVSLSFANAVS